METGPLGVFMLPAERVAGLVREAEKRAAALLAERAAALLEKEAAPAGAAD
jgi:hypothetical protein